MLCVGKGHRKNKAAWNLVTETELPRHSNTWIQSAATQLWRKYSAKASIGSHFTTQCTYLPWDLSLQRFPCREDLFSDSTPGRTVSAAELGGWRLPQCYSQVTQFWNDWCKEGLLMFNFITWQNLLKFMPCLGNPKYNLLTCVRMAELQKTEKNRCCQGWGERTLTHSW